MRYYLYNHIAGCHPSWTVAVLATSRANANKRINGPMWRGGRFAGEVDGVNVKADCGDVTEQAGEILHQRLEDEYQHCKAVEEKLTIILKREPTTVEILKALEYE